VERERRRAILRWAVVCAACLGIAVLVARWGAARAEEQFQAHLQKASVLELQGLSRQRDWDPLVFYWLGMRQKAQGDYEDAIKSLARAVTLNPKSSETRAALESTRKEGYNAHLREAGLPELMAIASRRGNDPVIWYWLGTRLTAEGRHKQAVQALSRSVSLNPKSAAAHAALGLVLARVDRPQPAEEQLKQALALNPQLQFAHFALGNLYGKYNRWEQAETELKAASEESPDDLEAHYLLATCYGNLFQEDLKMELLERLVKRAPDDIRFEKSLGYVYLFFGKFAQAEATYRHILSLAPNDVETHYLLGRALAEQASSPEAFAIAERELKGVAAGAPDRPGTYLALGILYFRRNEPARAVPELERAIRQGIMEQKTWLYLGQSYMRLGRIAEGKRTLDKFQHDASVKRTVTQLENRLLNTPGDTEVRLRLIHVSMDDHKYRRALNHLSILLEQKKNDVEALKLMRTCQAHITADEAKNGPREKKDEQEF
jgi:tetratricopeptide (TPR) repeat protein